MRLKQSRCIVHTAILFELANITDASPLKTPHPRATSFGPTTATQNEFASHALEVARSRVVNSSTCNAEDISIRKPWESLTSDERIAYTNAVKCLMDKPAKTPSDVAPGAKTRYDDFIVTHINQTLSIHSTASFLGWHRWFIWEMEQTLRNECNYTGSIPYWDWAKTAEEGFASSEMFDGSATSISGNGDPVNYTDSDVIVVRKGTPGEVVLPHGTGGGCVTNGPFANMTINLGPDGLLVTNGTNKSAWEFEYNPRCFKRDLTDYALQRYANNSSVLSLLRESDDIWTFETAMQGSVDRRPRRRPLRAGRRPGPGDPAFWSHHANIDRVWWMWQMQDPDARAANVSTAVRGSLTKNDAYEPHGNGTILSEQNLGYVAGWETVPLGELMSTTEGKFCYVYG
ncbi:hypothetical protein KVR01_005261 [Diaporthe batatas]|uniref:uncharacterized protein n=1 Tax=Diaporthe batatas TaxID=748121 RepID=UPI001D03E8CF|nr:uncharacterized protein KVR01_005261 [Diaporthe batatas]KAG8164986.1 hypothetical protein KVR01_005261 [Diaporthe batatas]